jgi:hypothetical protein
LRRQRTEEPKCISDGRQGGGLAHQLEGQGGVAN